MRKIMTSSVKECSFVVAVSETAKLIKTVGCKVLCRNIATGRHNLLELIELGSQMN